MTIQAITNFILVTTRDGSIKHRYQNGLVGQTIKLDGINYSFLSFFYQGATKNRTGDNFESELILASNKVAMNIAIEAVENNWIVDVTTCSMNPTTFAVGRILTKEIWQAASLGYDPERVTVSLNSGIDAVGGSAPTRVLTSGQVGALPTTASISNR